MFTFLQKSIGGSQAFILLIVAFATTIQAYDYIITPEDPDLISACSGAEADSFDTLWDLTDLRREMYPDDVYELSGSFRFLWDLGETDNFEFIVNTYKEKGSEYVPTIFNSQRKDGCTAIFDPEEMWYDLFFANIYDDDKVCPTHHKEVVWNMHPSNFSLILKNVEGSNQEGNYKIVSQWKPYDQNGKYYDDLALCFQMLGYMTKL